MRYYWVMTGLMPMNPRWVQLQVELRSSRRYLILGGAALVERPELLEELSEKLRSILGEANILIFEEQRTQGRCYQGLLPPGAWELLYGWRDTEPQPAPSDPLDQPATEPMPDFFKRAFGGE